MHAKIRTYDGPAVNIQIFSLACCIFKVKLLPDVAHNLSQ